PRTRSSRQHGASAENTVGASTGPVHYRAMHTPPFVASGFRPPLSPASASTWSRWARSRARPTSPPGPPASSTSAPPPATAADPDRPRRVWPPSNLSDLERHAADFAARAGACLDVVLAGERTSGTWVPEKQAWTDTA